MSMVSSEFQSLNYFISFLQVHRYALQHVIDGNLIYLICRSSYTGIGIHKLMDDGTLGPEKLVYGYPEGAKINFVTW
jgi:hypothetical protein